MYQPIIRKIFIRSLIVIIVVGVCVIGYRTGQLAYFATVKPTTKKTPGTVQGTTADAGVLGGLFASPTTSIASLIAGVTPVTKPQFNTTPTPQPDDGQSATPTPSPDATPTPSDEPTPTPSSSPEPSATPVPTPTPTPVPTPSPSPTPTPPLAPLFEIL